MIDLLVTIIVRNALRLLRLVDYLKTFDKIDTTKITILLGYISIERLKMIDLLVITIERNPLWLLRLIR